MNKADYFFRLFVRSFQRVCIFRSAQPSRISLKDSRIDLLLHGLKSNPHSFSIRHNEVRDDTEQLCSKLDDLLEEDRSSSEEGLKEKLQAVAEPNYQMFGKENLASNVNRGLQLEDSLLLKLC